MQTGERLGGDGDVATATAMAAIRDEAAARRADKAARKAAFDSEYDVGEYPMYLLSADCSRQNVGRSTIEQRFSGVVKLNK